MAFQQPQRQQPRPRSFSSNAPPPVSVAVPAPAPQRQSPRQDTQEWILFSPAPPSDTYGHTDSTVRSDRITGHLSDFGSLETAAVSDRLRGRPERLGQDNHVDDANEENGTEDLDSLDDGLHEFNEPSLDSSQRRLRDHTGDTVLPTHDGLGMFPGNSSPVQEQFWQHERYNPRRRRQSLRRSSLQRKFDALEEGPDKSAEDDKVERIEQWRMEQSRAILEEIEKETRRRRRRKSRASSSRIQRTASNTSNEPPPAKIEQTVPTPPPQPPTSERLSFWERLTRSVIRNLMGIDDATLEFIFGEALPPEPAPEKASPASELIDQAERAISNDGQLSTTTESWEERLLARIAKELGILLGHISEHPGAFTTYLRAQEPPPYAGLPTPSQTPSHPPKSKSSTKPRPMNPSMTSPHFSPTLTHQHLHRHSLNTTDPSLWGIDEEDEDHPPTDSANIQPSTEEGTRLQREREYWERDLDVKMVFGFLRDRFSSPTSAPAPPQPQQSRSTSVTRPNILTPSPTTQSYPANPDSLRRAALIRHHHPLVSRNVSASASQQNSQARTRLHSSSAVPLSPILGRRSSYAAETESCASQSTKRSKTAHSGSSRNFWDIGGSAGGGGSLGTWSVGWGEV